MSAVFVNRASLIENHTVLVFKFKAFMLLNQSKENNRAFIIWVYDNKTNLFIYDEQKVIKSSIDTKMTMG